MVTKTPQWVRSHRNDPYVKKSKVDGYRSRAAYKLIEIDDKYHVLRNSSDVLDLGSAPGGWLQVILERTRAIAWGVDLLEIQPIGDFNNFARCDFRVINDYIDHDKFDLITSDMAPNFTGDHSIEHYRSVEMANGVLTLCASKLERGGSLVIKVITGSDSNTLFKTISSLFKSSNYFKPKSSRSSSSETYVVAMGFLG